MYIFVLSSAISFWLLVAVQLQVEHTLKIFVKEKMHQQVCKHHASHTTYFGPIFVAKNFSINNVA